jgi:hypothetical protein
MSASDEITPHTFEKVSPAEWVFTTYLGRKPETARLMAFAMQVAVVLLLVGMALMFLDWRAAFDKQGCAAFCNCTTRVLAGNGSVVVMPR